MTVPAVDAGLDPHPVARQLQRCSVPVAGQEARVPGLRRRRAPRRHGRCSARRPGPAPGGSPAAARICSSTRSSPVTALGHRVLDLQARVDLEEVEVVGRDQELHRAEGTVVDVPRPAPRQRRACAGAARAARAGQAPPRPPSGAGAAASIRAPTGADTPPCPSPSDLHLDVAAVRQVALDDQRRVAEGVLAPSRIAAAISSSRPSGECRMRMPLPPPPAAAFSSTGKPTAAHHSGHDARVGARAGRAGDRRHADLHRQPLGRGLVTEVTQHLRRGADEGDAGLLQARQRIRRSRTGSHSRDARRRRRRWRAACTTRRVPGSCRAPAPHRCAPTRRCRAHAAHRGRPGMHGGHLQPHAAAGARDAARDLAPVRDQDLLEHAVGPHMRKTPKRVSCFGVRDAASSSSASAPRVSSGSSTPSTHSRDAKL